MKEVILKRIPETKISGQPGREGRPKLTLMDGTVQYTKLTKFPQILSKINF